MSSLKYSPLLAFLVFFALNSSYSWSFPTTTPTSAHTTKKPESCEISLQMEPVLNKGNVTLCKNQKVETVTKDTINQALSQVQASFNLSWWMIEQWSIATIQKNRPETAKYYALHILNLTHPLQEQLNAVKYENDSLIYNPNDSLASSIDDLHKYVETMHILINLLEKSNHSNATEYANKLDLCIGKLSPIVGSCTWSEYEYNKGHCIPEYAAMWETLKFMVVLERKLRDIRDQLPQA